MKQLNVSQLADHVRAWFEHQALAAPTKTTPIIVAVSGGADSMALAIGLAQAFEVDSLRAVTVDHGLRYGSAAEARWAVDQLEAHGITAQIITLKKQKADTGNLQAWAREQRYRALQGCCETHGSPYVATAHTLDDQAETVLARLARASGTKGLAAMAPVASLPLAEASAVHLIRPLLTVRRQDLRCCLMEVGQRWAEDPSNRAMRFDRVRVRQFLALWEEAGFDPARIAASAAQLRRSDDALEHYAEQAFHDLTAPYADGLKVKRAAFLALPQDTQIRLLRRILRRVGNNSSELRAQKLERVIEAIEHSDLPRTTLHSTLITLNQNDILVTPEEL
ncbi:MAG: tRNA lysidine(34) synthetase TilS [Pseudomonadota bacterium]